MMGNKWMQAGILFGVAMGIWLGGWLVLIHPAIHLVIGPIIGIGAMWIGANARGTDGWGGPWNGPNPGDKRAFTSEVERRNSPRTPG